MKLSQKDAAPITLIDGEKLIGLLIHHGIGVSKKTHEASDLDLQVFAEVEEFIGAPTLSAPWPPAGAGETDHV